MKGLFDGLVKYGIGSRPMTEEDFYRICEQENITVIWSPKKFAFHFSALGENIIVLPRRRRGIRLLFSMFHELAHVWMHSGDEVVMWEGMLHTRDEVEADAIALVALIPKDRMHEMAFLDGSRFGGHLWNERMRIYFLYDI